MHTIWHALCLWTSAEIRTIWSPCKRTSFCSDCYRHLALERLVTIVLHVPTFEFQGVASSETTSDSLP